MTMHRIILDTLWTIASEALCLLPKNTVNLSTTTQAKTKMVIVVLVVGKILGSWLEKFSQ